MGQDEKCILLTGGAGYIGSHCVIECLQAGYTPVIIDNMANASQESIRRVEEITGQTITCYSADVLDRKSLEDVFSKHKFHAVIHLASRKSVGESCDLPLLYYKTNVNGTINLLEVMSAYNVKKIVFSSSATVYGTPDYLPLDEKHAVGNCTNPYGKTKYFVETIIQDLCTADKDWDAIVLRYFNPVGSHKSGKIGEDPNGPPNNLMPYMAQVAVQRRKELQIFGNDYDTPDGTGVRDYIHVIDLAQGHVTALRKLDDKPGCKAINLGTGKGYSVLDMVKSFEKASGKEIPYKICPRRAGDIGSVYADVSLAERELGWKATRDLDEMCEDLWRWQSMNPHGYNADSAT